MRTNYKLMAVAFAVLAATLTIAAKKQGDDTSNPAYATTPVTVAPDTSGKPAKPAGFIHPGVLVNRAQLDEIKKRVAAGKEPQKPAFGAAKGTPVGPWTVVAHPGQPCGCGPHSNPDLGCKAEQADSASAYCQALLWYITGNKAYAENAIAIMNGWSSNIPAADNSHN